jgi:hypothetical protein
LTEEPDTFEQYVNLIKERLKLKENLEYLTISDQEELVNIYFFISMLLKKCRLGGKSHKHLRE